MIPAPASPRKVETISAVLDVSDPLSVRDQATLESFDRAGLRCLELVGRDVNDVDRSRGAALAC